MTETKTLTIDPNESFPTLARAPIVEAIIHIHTRAESEWKEDKLRAHLTEKCTEYPIIQSRTDMQFGMVFNKESTPTPFRNDSWGGVRLVSNDKLHIAQFNRDSFVFSRLAPYQSWDHFRGEALRLWSIYVDVAKPSEIQRLGMRFINCISIREKSQLNYFLCAPPKVPENLGLSLLTSLHQDQFAVPEYPAYAINRIQALQSLPSNAPDERTLIVDIDVFTCQPDELQPGQPSLDMLKRRLGEMRWLKNKTFFGSITSDAIEHFKGGSP